MWSRCEPLKDCFCGIRSSSSPLPTVFLSPCRFLLDATALLLGVAARMVYHSLFDGYDGRDRQRVGFHTLGCAFNSVWLYRGFRMCWILDEPYVTSLILTWLSMYVPTIVVILVSIVLLWLIGRRIGQAIKTRRFQNQQILLSSQFRSVGPCTVRLIHSTHMVLGPAFAYSRTRFASSMRSPWATLSSNLFIRPPLSTSFLFVPPRPPFRGLPHLLALPPVADLQFSFLC